ncbi:putative membrane protein [Anaplasma phagocytophilum str. ApNP]|uniref:Putative membrane protein n=1 Tax=Anaplasma phagocytophilum str. ApNP TaxID=1359153 RepID=A0A0F3NFE2_ANAPH|nr:putative membrane protein [Anaplasma phagocytophilum str. ApNP]
MVACRGCVLVALSVSCNFVFLYVLFEALLYQADIGRFFMRLSFG